MQKIARIIPRIISVGIAVVFIVSLFACQPRLTADEYHRIHPIAALRIRMGTIAKESRGQPIATTGFASRMRAFDPAGNVGWRWHDNCLFFHGA
jgi:hypothetical protein